MELEETKARMREEAESLDLFDASAWLGYTSAFPLMEEGTPERLESVHRKSFIREALVSHWASSGDSSLADNNCLLKGIDGHDNWYATITLNPLFPPDPGSPASAGWTWPKKVKAARVFPAAFRYALTDWCAGSLCELLLERRLPLFVLHTETTFQDLYQIAKRYPKLPIVLEGQTRKIIYHMRMVLPLMKECPNVHLEISNLCSQGMVEYVVQNIGPGQLIFGTFAPANDPLVPLGLLLGANISRDEKRAIAGGNIRRIIKEVHS